MGTSCTVIITSKYETLHLYRHSDGSPEEIIPELTKLTKEITTDMRTNGFHPSNINRFVQFLIQRTNLYQPASTITWDSEYIYFLEFEDEKISIKYTAQSLEMVSRQIIPEIL